jgi:rhamnosyltransferase
MPSSRPTHPPGPATTRGNRTVAVVPTYHPDASFAERLALLAAQVDEVIIVDDGSGPGADPVLDAAAAAGHQVIRLPRNAGIAAALNAGVRAALVGGTEFIVNLDQDTVLPADYVTTALDIFAKANPVTRVGIVCVDAVNGAPTLPTWTSPEGFGLVEEAIQTGFVISRECLESAGLFDERLVIDTVDTEYCLRVRDAGFRIAVAKGTDVQHALGRQVELRPFGFPVRDDDGRVKTYQYHSPFRRYYIARNNIDLMYRYRRSRPIWVRHVAKRERPVMIRSIVSGPQRRAQLLAISVGTIHGLVRRRGMIPRWLRKTIS